MPDSGTRIYCTAPRLRRLSVSAGALLASEEQVRAVARLELAKRTPALKELLLSRNQDDLLSWIFREEALLRPSLRLLANDAAAGAMARSSLAMIAVREDIRWMTRLSPLASGRDEPWTYFVACALLEPRTDREREFLRRIAGRESNPIQTFTVPVRTLQGKDLSGLALRTSQALRESGDWLENDPPRFNKAGDKALVDLRFDQGRCVATYTATYHRTGGIWKLRGVAVTLLSLIPVVAPTHLPR